MHSRFDTASLHAACTSVSEAHDNALTLQTDLGMFSRKPVVKDVAPTPDQLTNDLDYAHCLHNVHWCILKEGNEDHYAVEDGFGYSDNQNANSQTFNSITFLMSPHNTHTPLTLETDLKILPQDLTHWKLKKVMKDDWPYIRWMRHPLTFFKKMESDHRPYIWNRTRAVKILSPQVLQYFTRNLKVAMPFKYTNASPKQMIFKQYGIIKRRGQKHYFEVQDVESDKDGLNLLNIGVKMCQDYTSTRLTFNDTGPVDVRKWKSTMFFVEDLQDNVLYIRNPNEYFASSVVNQDKWPLSKQEARLPTVTNARTNPYLVLRVGAATALDPDASWQTDGWPRLSIPNLRHKKKKIGELPMLEFDGKYSWQPNKIPRASIDEMNIALEQMKYYPSQTSVMWRLYDIQYWMELDSKKAVKCYFQHSEHLVYACLQLCDEQIYQCLVIGTPTAKALKSFYVFNLTTKIQEEQQREIPTRPCVTTMWFSDKPATIWHKLRAGRN